MSLALAYRPNRLVIWSCALVALLVLMLAHPHFALANNLKTNVDMSNLMADINTNGADSSGGSVGTSWFNFHTLLSIILFIIVPIVTVVALIPVLHSLGESKNPGALAWSFIQIGGILVVAVICIMAPIKLMSSSTAQAALLDMTVSSATSR